MLVFSKELPIKNSAFTTLFALLVALLPGAARMALGQPLNYPGGVTVLTRTFDPAHPDKSVLAPVYGDPNLLREVVNTAWGASRSSIEDQITEQMGRANSVAEGVTPYDIVCKMAKQGDLKVSPGSYANGSTLELFYLVRGNYIEFTTTQPTALGKWADPRFSCTYDLGLTLSLRLGDAPGPLTVSSVKAQVSNAKLDSHGLIADLVFIGNDVTKLFGSDYIKRAQNAVDGKNFDFTDKLNQGLSPFNSLLAQYGSLASSLLNAPNAALPSGLSPRSLPGSTPQGPQLLLFMDKNGALPTRGSGTISGAIRWKKTLGEPTLRDNRPSGSIVLGRGLARHPYARAFRIRAVAQSGFAHEGMFSPPMSEVGVLQSVTLDPPTSSRDGTQAGTGDEYVLRYSIEQLPTNIPIKVEVSLTGVPWAGEIGAGQTRGVGPMNWTGVITIRPGLNIKTNGVFQGKESGIGALLRQKTPGGGAANAGERSIIIVSGKNKGDAVSLNPQPLPPGPDPDRVQTTRQGFITPGKGGIIGSRIRPNFTRIQPGAAMRQFDTRAVPIVIRDNPTGAGSVGDINFEVGLITGPR